MLDEPARPKTCKATHGLISEANALIAEAPVGALRDAVMITSAQKVEHYEIATYGTVRTYAEVLTETEVATLLADTLREENKADLKLTQIAQDSVNKRAAAEWHERHAGESTAARKRPQRARSVSN